MALSVFKIFTETQWKQFQSDGTFAGSPTDLKDGFIHLSRAEQVKGVIDRYYAGIRPLYIAEFSAEAFGKALLFEPASNKELYPHLHGKALLLKELLTWHSLEG